MADSTKVRRARRGDAEALEALWVQFLEEQAAHDARFTIASDARERWANDFPYWLHDDARRIFVAEAGGALVGFADAARWAPPPVYAGAPEVYVNELYVLPGRRGEGLGERLVDEIRRWAEDVGAARLRLGVLAENAAARAFWASRGARDLSVTMTIDLDAAPAEATRQGARKIGF